VTRIVMVLTATVVLAGGTYGQPLPADKLPASVRDAFKSKFPGVDKAEWKLKSDKNYEAEFTLKGVEVAAKFDEKGKWLETETAIEESALPKDVRATVEKEYKGCKIVETQKVERTGDKPILFEVHLEKGEEILKVQLEPNGTIASKSSKRKKGQ
jgi:Putative beta-lactamase-inhibitor-like, PepSY-like